MSGSLIEDTIAAISTPIGVGGIAIIRVSGKRALQVADAIFVSKAGKPSSFPTHTIHLGRVCDNGNSVDQVLLSIMRAPRSYTAEDVVEINCHGGPLTARDILALCVKHGARLAEPGEFTKRAFLNGRIDLTQAEAVMDLINAKTRRAQAAAELALEGHLSKGIAAARDKLIEVLAHIEAHIDFPEEDIDTGTRKHWLREVDVTIELLRSLLASANEGKILRHGIAVAIVGRPNAGKSSLMNALLGEERSIVTPIPGTTRDTIEEFASIRGLPVKFTDTAGIRNARSAVEAIGINRSRTSLSHSDLLLHVVDGSRRFSEDDRELARLCDSQKTIQVVSKSDLPQKLNLPADVTLTKNISVSAKTGAGIELLKDSIESVAIRSHGQFSESCAFVNERQVDTLQRANYSLTSAVIELRNESPPELVSQQLRTGLDAIGEVTGSTSTEDLLDKIFSSFCIGK